MDYICINASPRQNMNSAKLLDSAVEELEKNGKKVKTYNLYDLDFKGCYSCFACKKEGKKSYGECIIKDDLKEVLKQIDQAEGLILASPIYFQDLPGEMRSFLERLLFRKFIYSNPPRTLTKDKKRVGFIYTMNIDKNTFENSIIGSVVDNVENKISSHFGTILSYKSFGTNQLNNYKGIEYTYFDPEERLKNHKENFPTEIENVKKFAREVLL